MNQEQKIAELAQVYKQSVQAIDQLESRVHQLQSENLNASSVRDLDDLIALKELLNEAKIKEKELAKKIRDLQDLNDLENRKNQPGFIDILKSIGIALVEILVKNQLLPTEISHPIETLKRKVEDTKETIRILVFLDHLRSSLLIAGITSLAMTILWHMERLQMPIGYSYLVPITLLILYGLFLLTTKILREKNKK